AVPGRGRADLLAVHAAAFRSPHVVTAQAVLRHAGVPSHRGALARAGHYPEPAVPRLHDAQRKGLVPPLLLLLLYQRAPPPRHHNSGPRACSVFFPLLWPFPWSLLAPAALGLSYRQPDRASRTRLLALSWAGFILVFFTFSTTQEYYSMPAYPALALLLGSAI